MARQPNNSPRLSGQLVLTTTTACSMCSSNATIWYKMVGNRIELLTFQNPILPLLPHLVQPCPQKEYCVQWWRWQGESEGVRGERAFKSPYTSVCFPLCRVLLRPVLSL